MSTFVLVHGAWHGAWCWERLIPELTERGHQALAMDLPCDQHDAGLEQYAEAVVSACALVDGPIIAVGHSLAGLVIPMLPEHRPVDRLVFLNALIARPGLQLADMVATEPFAVPNQPVATTDEASGWSYWDDDDAARTVMYHDCSPEDADWAAKRLRRQGLRPVQQCHPLKRWPRVPSSYVLCTEDRCVDPAWSRRVATQWLGTTALELRGSHSPFLAQPANLASILDQLAIERTLARPPDPA